MATTKVTVKKLSEVSRNAVNRGSVANLSRPALTGKGIEAYDGMTLEEVKAKAEAEFADAAAESGTLAMSAAIQVWFDKHPQYAVIDKRNGGNDKTAKKNSAAILEELYRPESLSEMERGRRAFRDRRSPKGWNIYPNYWDVEMAAARAEAQGKLTADPQELYKQQVSAVEAQISPSPQQEDEDEAYSMDMHELRRRCTPGSYDPLGPQ